MKRPSSFRLGGRRLSEAASLLLLAPFLILLAVVFLLPLGTLIHESLLVPAPTLANYERVFAEPVYLRVMWRTLRIAVYVTVVALLLGYPLAYVMARSKGLVLGLMAAAVLLPLWTSVLVRTYAWMVLLQRNGLINQALKDLGIVDAPVRLLYTEGAVVLAMSHVLLPFMVLPIWAVLSRLDATLPRAARSLGASAAGAFWHVTFPLSLPGLAAGATLVFMSAIGFYITPALLGGPSDLTIASLIEMVVRDLLDWPFGAILSLTLLACVACVFAIGAVLAGAGRITGADRA